MYGKRRRLWINRSDRTNRKCRNSWSDWCNRSCGYSWCNGSDRYRRYGSYGFNRSGGTNRVWIRNPRCNRTYRTYRF
jgi:hypothetical protein